MKLTIPVTCPNCNRQFTQQLDQMRGGTVRRCTGCGTEFRFSGDGGPRAQKTLDDFTASLKRMFTRR